MVVDPTRITQYDRTDAELEEFLLFGIAVAGKRSMQIRDALERFLSGRQPDETPFEYIRRLQRDGTLRERLVDARISPYGSREQGFIEAANLGDLRTVSLDRLESVHGVGPKTARFFLVHSRPDVRHAILDTHILAWLREQGHEAPRVTPSQNPRLYRRLENVFLDECARHGITPAELDLAIWTTRATV